jgi:hypothetical protein
VYARRVDFSDLFLIGFSLSSHRLGKQLKSQEEDAPRRVLFFKPTSWLGQIRTHRRDESWSASLSQTFFFTSVGTQIPVIAEKPLEVCGCRKFQVDALGDHLCTCTAHSGAKKAHDWAVYQLPDLFRTTHKAKTHQVVKIRGQYCGDIELVGYLANASGPVPLVLDLRVAHDRVGSSVDPTLKYRADYNFNPPRGVGFMATIASTSGHLHSEFIRILFLQVYRETDRFFAT